MIGQIVGDYRVVSLLGKAIYSAECLTCHTVQPVHAAALGDSVCVNRNCGKDLDPAKTAWRKERQAELDAEARQQAAREQTRLETLREEGKSQAFREMKETNEGVTRDLSNTKHALSKAKTELDSAKQEIAALQKQIPPPLTTELERKQIIITKFLADLSDQDAQACWEYIKASGLDGTDPESWQRAHVHIAFAGAREMQQSVPRDKQDPRLQRIRNGLKQGDA